MGGRWGIALVAAVGVGAAAATGPPAGGGPALAIESAGPLFGPGNAGNLRPGEVRSACATVVNRGGRPVRGALFLTGRAGDLAPHLRVRIERGAACAGFRASALLYAGRLSEAPSSLRDAIVEPEAWEPGARRAYRFALAVADDQRAAGRDAWWDWRLGVEALPAVARAPSGRAPVRHGAASLRCSVLATRSRRRKLVKRVHVVRRIRAVLIVFVFGRPGREHLVLHTGLRVRGKTLLVRRWARVGYRVNGRRYASGVRPFRVRVPRRVLRLGTNVVRVRVDPRRGRAHVSRFRLRIKRTKVNGRTTCVIG
jgi:hypothetical protein